MVKGFASSYMRKLYFFKAETVTGYFSVEREKKGLLLIEDRWIFIIFLLPLLHGEEKYSCFLRFTNKKIFLITQWGRNEGCSRSLSLSLSLIKIKQYRLPYHPGKICIFPSSSKERLLHLHQREKSQGEKDGFLHRREETLFLS